MLAFCQLKSIWASQPPTFKCFTVYLCHPPCDSCSLQVNGQTAKEYGMVDECVSQNETGDAAYQASVQMARKIVPQVNALWHFHSLLNKEKGLFAKAVEQFANFVQITIYDRPFSCSRLAHCWLFWSSFDAEMISGIGGIDLIHRGSCSVCFPQGPIAVAMAKKAVNEGLEQSLEDGLRTEWACYENVSCMILKCMATRQCVVHAQW